MCLVCENLNYKIAEEDIVCYKVVFELDKKSYMTPYQQYCCKLDEHCVNKGTISIKRFSKDSNYYIYGGMFHSYQKLSDACLDMLWFNSLGKHTIVIKCIIPKGTHYIEGNFGNMVCTPCYGSREIIYKEEHRNCKITVNK